MKWQTVQYVTESLKATGKHEFYFQHEPVPLEVIKEQADTLRAIIPYPFSMGYANRKEPGLVNISIPKPIFDLTLFEDELYLVMYPIRVNGYRPYRYAYDVVIYSMVEDLPELIKYRFSPHLVKEHQITKWGSLDLELDNPIMDAIKSLINAAKNEVSKNERT